MAKDSPYFKFYVSEYNDGDIQLCSMEAQGLFTNLCSLYWSREGNLFLSKAKKLYKVRDKVWMELVNERVIKVDDDKIIINFLDEQMDERDELSKQNSKNVSKRYQKQNKEATPVEIRSTENGIPVYNIEEKKEEENKGEDNKRRGEETLVIVSQTFDEKFDNAFDALTLESYKINFPLLDIEGELRHFRLKCNNDKATYHSRDPATLRTNFQYQLKHARPTKTKSKIQHELT